MAFPKDELFPFDDQQISSYGRALGYPARISILRILEVGGPKQVMDLVKILPISAGAITEHLKKLRQAGLLQVEVHRLMNFYAVDKAGLFTMAEIQSEFLRDLGVSQNGIALLTEDGPGKIRL